MHYVRNSVSTVRAVTSIRSGSYAIFLLIRAGLRRYRGAFGG
jgi:hypothetical protein